MGALDPAQPSIVNEVSVLKENMAPPGKYTFFKQGEASWRAAL